MAHGPSLGTPSWPEVIWSLTIVLVAMFLACPHNGKYEPLDTMERSWRCGP